MAAIASAWLSRNVFQVWEPHYITAPDRPILTIAGLWSEWRDRVNDETLATCTMIITTANKLVSTIHDRMPVILEPDSFEAWLSGTAGTEIAETCA